LKLSNTSIVYYDGSCRLCQKEISFYKNQLGADKIKWLNLATIPSEKIDSELTKNVAMKRFHVKLENGQIISGASAFIALWKTLPKFSRIGQFLDSPRKIFILEYTYKIFLVFRPFLQKLTNLKI